MSQVTWAYNILLAFHLIGLALGFGAAFMADFSFFRSLKLGDSISPETVAWMRSFSKVVWLGLGILGLSGIGLFLLNPAEHLHSSGFLAKMCMVLVLVINGLFLNYYTTARLTTFNFSDDYQQHGAAWKARKLSFVFGAISTTSWYVILFVAVLKSVVHIPFASYIAIYLALLTSAVIGGLMLERIIHKRLRQRTGFEITSQNVSTVPISALVNSQVSPTIVQPSITPQAADSQQQSAPLNQASIPERALLK